MGRRASRSQPLRVEPENGLFGRRLLDVISYPNMLARTRIGTHPELDSGAFYGVIALNKGW